MDTINIISNTVLICVNISIIIITATTIITTNIISDSIFLAWVEKFANSIQYYLGTLALRDAMHHDSLSFNHGHIFIGFVYLQALKDVRIKCANNTKTPHSL